VLEPKPEFITLELVPVKGGRSERILRHFCAEMVHTITIIFDMMLFVRRPYAPLTGCQVVSDADLLLQTDFQRAELEGEFHNTAVSPLFATDIAQVYIDQRGCVSQSQLIAGNTPDAFRCDGLRC